MRRVVCSIVALLVLSCGGSKSPMRPASSPGDIPDALASIEYLIERVKFLERHCIFVPRGR